MNKDCFNKDLNKKILYKTPLFIVDLVFKDVSKPTKKSIKGGNNLSIQFNNKEQLRYNNALDLDKKNQLDNNACDIFRFNIDNVLFINTPFINIKKTEINEIVKSLKDEINKNDEIIYKSHSIKSGQTHEFLYKWYSSTLKTTIDKSTVRNYEQELEYLKLHFIIGKTYIPRYDIINNPLFNTYTTIRKK